MIPWRDRRNWIVVALGAQDWNRARELIEEGEEIKLQNTQVREFLELQEFKKQLTAPVTPIKPDTIDWAAFEARAKQETTFQLENGGDPDQVMRDVADDMRIEFGITNDSANKQSTRAYRVVANHVDYWVRHHPKEDAA